MPGREMHIGVVDDFPEGDLVYRDIPSFGLRLILCRLLGTMYAIENQCSHQQQTMDGAKREYQEVRCPHHGVCYDLRDGSVRWDQGYQGLEACRSFEVVEREGQVFVLIPDALWLND